jgi:hypothetical protein
LLHGFGAHSGNWGGYWGKQGPELLAHRLALYAQEQRMVFGANTFRAHAQMLASSTEESEVPLRSHGSLSLNRALMAAGLVDRVQVTPFPVNCLREHAIRRKRKVQDLQPKRWASESCLRARDPRNHAEVSRIFEFSHLMELARAKRR